MPQIVLRDYQEESLEGLRQGIRDGHRCQVLCLGTGAGKTVVAGELIRYSLFKGSRVAFVADRIALVDQTSLRLAEAGIPHGVVRGGASFGRHEPVQICSAQTLERRGNFPRVDLLIIDECHSMRAFTSWMIQGLGVPVIGLTATPFTRGLGRIYTNIVNVCTTDYLIERGWLVPLKFFYCKTRYDMKGAPSPAGEWSGAEIERRGATIVGDIIEEWIKYTNKIFGGPVKTLVFSPTVNYGYDLCQRWNSLGYRFEQVSYRESSSSGKRRRKIEALREGSIDGLISVEALAKGLDIPDVLTICDARPYKGSLASYIQMLGRGMRSAPGKDSCLILDYSGNWIRHCADVEDFWANGIDFLDDGTSKKKRKQAKTKERENKERECFGCHMVMPKDCWECPNCGRMRKRRKTRVTQTEGQMVEYKSITEVVPDLWPHISTIAIERYPATPSKAQRFAMAQFKSLTGKWPKWGTHLNTDGRCDPRVREAVERSLKSWIAKQRRKGYAKRSKGKG